jgi:hypothetical protein
MHQDKRDWEIVPEILRYNLQKSISPLRSTVQKTLNSQHKPKQTFGLLLENFLVYFETGSSQPPRRLANIVILYFIIWTMVFYWKLRHS